MYRFKSAYTASNWLNAFTPLATTGDSCAGSAGFAA